MQSQPSQSTGGRGRRGQRAQRTGHDKRLLELLQYVIRVLQLQERAHQRGLSAPASEFACATRRERAHGAPSSTPAARPPRPAFPSSCWCPAEAELRHSPWRGIACAAAARPAQAGAVEVRSRQRTLNMRSMSACAFSFSTRPSLARMPALASASCAARVMSTPRPRARCTQAAPQRCRSEAHASCRRRRAIGPAAGATPHASTIERGAVCLCLVAQTRDRRK